MFSTGNGIFFPFFKFCYTLGSTFRLHLSNRFIFLNINAAREKSNCVQKGRRKFGTLDSFSCIGYYPWVFLSQKKEYLPYFTYFDNSMAILFYEGINFINLQNTAVFVQNMTITATTDIIIIQYTDKERRRR